MANPAQTFMHMQSAKFQAVKVDWLKSYQSLAGSLSDELKTFGGKAVQYLGKSSISIFSHAVSVVFLDIQKKWTSFSDAVKVQSRAEVLSITQTKKPATAEFYQKMNQVGFKLALETKQINTKIYALWNQKMAEVRGSAGYIASDQHSKNKMETYFCRVKADLETKMNQMDPPVQVFTQMQVAPNPRKRSRVSAAAAKPALSARAICEKVTKTLSSKLTQVHFMMTAYMKGLVSMDKDVTDYAKQIGRLDQVELALLDAKSTKVLAKTQKGIDLIHEIRVFQVKLANLPDAYGLQYLESLHKDLRKIEKEYEEHFLGKSEDKQRELIMNDTTQLIREKYSQVAVMMNKRGRLSKEVKADLNKNLKKDVTGNENTSKKIRNLLREVNVVISSLRDRVASRVAAPKAKQPRVRYAEETRVLPFSSLKAPGLVREEGVEGEDVVQEGTTRDDHSSYKKADPQGFKESAIRAHDFWGAMGSAPIDGVVPVAVPSATDLKDLLAKSTARKAKKAALQAQASKEAAIKALSGLK